MGIECQVKMMAYTKALSWDGGEDVPSNERKGSMNSKKGTETKRQLIGRLSIS